MIVPRLTESKYNWRDESLRKKRQQWVLLHPCQRFEECGRLGYRILFKGESGIKFISVLTIDLFTQPWAWHSQVGIIGENGKAKPSGSYTLPERLEAVELASHLLIGVGCNRPRFSRDDLSLTFSKTLTIEETAIALAMQGNAPKPDLFPVGEVNIYDADDLSTFAGSSLLIPKTRTVLYGRGN